MSICRRHASNISICRRHASSSSGGERNSSSTRGRGTFPYFTVRNRRRAKPHLVARKFRFVANKRCRASKLCDVSGAMICVTSVQPWFSDRWRCYPFHECPPESGREFHMSCPGPPQLVSNHRTVNPNQAQRPG